VRFLESFFQEEADNPRCWTYEREYAKCLKRRGSGADYLKGKEKRVAGTETTTQQYLVAVRKRQERLDDHLK
jgi:hypothetical protein